MSMILWMTGREPEQVQGVAQFSDRHIDLFWGIWSLNYNLHTPRYTDRFLDAYGRDGIDPDKLRCVAAMETVSDG